MNPTVYLCEPSSGPPAAPLMEIRRSTLDDIEALWRLVDDVARERRFLVMVQAPPLNESRAFLEQAYSNGMIQFVAVDEGTMIGWCDVTPVRWEGFRHSGRLGMGISSTHRGRGVGAQLLRVALEEAQRAGLTRVELEVFRSNTPAIALYKRFGFVEEGVKRQARRLDGAVDDTVCMALIT